MSHAEPDRGEKITAGKFLLDELLERLDYSNSLTDEELGEEIDRLILEKARGLYLTLEQRKQIHRELFNRLRRLDILQELLEDDTVSEIMVNGADHVFVERDGRLEPVQLSFSSVARLEDVIQQIAGKIDRRVNLAHPIVDARLEDGARVNAVLRPIALDGPILTIRKFARKAYSLEQLSDMGMLTGEAVLFLKEMVEAGANLFISGGTGSGKTTFLNALAECIPAVQRVITIEDSAELKISSLPNLVRLETREENEEGTAAVTIRDLIRAALRMRPDRIIVGEVRDGACLDMLQAMNTGHDGSLCTGHGNSPKDMLARLETMALMGADLPLTAIRGQIGAAINYIIHLSRMRDGSRKVVSITEVMGYDRQQDEILLRTIFAREGEGRELCRLEESPWQTAEERQKQ